MRIIAHRGNINGPDEFSENRPDTILAALEKGYDVEVDLHVVDKKFYLGHDKPQYLIEPEFLMNQKIWVHCKNSEALRAMSEQNLCHYFWHQSDAYTITSKGFIWTYVWATLIPNQYSVCVLPEMSGRVKKDLLNCAGVCTDFPEQFI